MKPRQTPISPALVSMYLRNADISPLFVFSAAAGQVTMVTPREPARVPNAVRLEQVYWFPGRLLAGQVSDAVTRLLAEGQFKYRPNSEWVEFRTENADTLVSTAITHMNIKCVLDADAKARASFQVGRVEDDFKKRLETGELKAAAGRRYREMRLAAKAAGKRAPVWEAHIRALKERAVQESARHWGRAAILTADMRAEARFEARAEAILTQIAIEDQRPEGEVA